MNWTGLDVFDQSIIRTNAWLKDFMQELNATDRRAAFHALKDALHAVRDRLQLESAVHLGNQLPLMIRGAYFEDWRPAAGPAAWNHQWDEATLRAVFRLLKRKADQGEMESVEDDLPQDLRQFWPHTLRAA